MTQIAVSKTPAAIAVNLAAPFNAHPRFGQENRIAKIINANTSQFTPVSPTEAKPRLVRHFANSPRVDFDHDL